jgi:hypothetical protein
MTRESALAVAGDVDREVEPVEVRERAGDVAGRLVARGVEPGTASECGAPAR